MFECWLITGDFNVLIYKDDKFMGRLVGNSFVVVFDKFVNKIGDIDINFQGPQFTCINNRANVENIKEHLDKVICLSFLAHFISRRFDPFI